MTATERCIIKLRLIAERRCSDDAEMFGRASERARRYHDYDSDGIAVSLADEAEIEQTIVLLRAMRDRARTSAVSIQQQIEQLPGYAEWSAERRAAMGIDKLDLGDAQIVDDEAAS